MVAIFNSQRGVGNNQANRGVAWRKGRASGTLLQGVTPLITGGIGMSTVTRGGTEGGGQEGGFRERLSTE